MISSLLVALVATPNSEEGELWQVVLVVALAVVGAVAVGLLWRLWDRSRNRLSERSGSRTASQSATRTAMPPAETAKSLRPTERVSLSQLRSGHTAAATMKQSGSTTIRRQR